MKDEAKTKEQLEYELDTLRQDIADEIKVSNEQLLAEIAERERAQQALLESQVRFAGILDIANEAIISIDQNQRIVLFNKGAETIFGYASTEVLGQPLDLLIPDRFTVAHREHIVDFAQTPETARLMGARQEIVGLRKDGREFPAEASISKLDLGGTKIFTVVLRDITERKRAQEGRESLIVQLRALNEAARAITAELSLEQVLQKIASTARELIQAKYAALGVHDGQRHLSRFITAGIEPSAHAKIGAFPTGHGLLKTLLQRGRTLLINDIKHHPTAIGFPDHHPVMRSLLGVPIYSKGKLLGALYLADKEDGSDFTESDQKLLEMLALHIAIAIENARLYEQTQRLAILEERERFARDLHDGIIQSIYAVGLALDQAKVDISPASQATREQIDLCLKSLSGVIQDIRNYIFDLRPQALKHQGLKARLEGLIAEVKVNTLLPIQAQIDAGVSDCLNTWQASHIFHICHEALSNAIRHAQPSRISIKLTGDGDLITLVVEDDGIGFELPTAIQPGHRGLGNIKARVAQLGATLKIDSDTRQGTRVSVQFRCDPLRDEIQ